MVQVEPNLTLTLEQLGPSGVALPAEKKAALSCSLPVKKAEAGLNTLHLWGCITARNGKDYLIAQGTCRSAGVNGGFGLVHRFYCSQDACKWADLPKVTEIKAEIALRLKSELSGDPAKLYVVKEPNPDAPPPPEDGEEADPEAESKRFIVHEISELDRLGVMIDQIQAATNVAPLGSQVVNAEGTLVPNKLFSGLDYPMRLESFVHLQGGCEGPTLAADVRGTWTLRYDGFCGLTLCRSLLYPGYSFYYNNNDCSWGGLYSGNGLKNDDLIFML